jgi:hypothetical protein
MRKKVTAITEDAAPRQYIPYGRIQSLGRRGYVMMTWTSDRTGIMLYTMLGAFLMLSSIYVPA